MTNEKERSPGAPAPGSTEEKCGAERRSEISSRGPVLHRDFSSRVLWGIPGRFGFGRVAVVDCRDCRYRNQCLEYSRMYLCRDWSKKGGKKSEQAYRKESREEA